ncbi:MAG: porin [Rhizobacter sp.]|nr:porin [Rhizobacter sp.]
MTHPLKAVALAAAFSCLPVAALAQSSASVYGLIDMSAGQFQDAGAEKIYKAQSGNMATSFLGFKGTEELGGTIKANFAIETFLRADTGEAGRFGGDVFWARAAWVGLQGEFGATKLGRTTNQFFVSTLIFNAFGDSFGYSPSIRQVLTPSVVHPQMLAFLGDTGWSNSILYSSPSSGGFSFNLQGSLGEGAASARGRNVGVNVLYFGGPFAATVAAQQVKQGISGFTPAIQSAGFESQDSVQVGASYDLKVVKLFGQYSQVKTKATVETKSTIYGLGVSAPVGPGKVLAQYGNAKAEFPSSEVVNKTLTVGYDYYLSKSTDIYALVMNDKFTDKATGNTLALGLKLKF